MAKKRLFRKISFAVSLLIVFVLMFGILSIGGVASVVYLTGNEDCDTACANSKNAFDPVCISVGSTTAANDFKMKTYWYDSYHGCFPGMSYMSTCKTRPGNQQGSCPIPYIWCKCSDVNPADTTGKCVKEYSGYGCDNQLCEPGLLAEYNCGILEYNAAYGWWSSGSSSQCEIPSGETWIPSNSNPSAGWADSGAWAERLCYHHGNTPYCFPSQYSGGPWANVGKRNWKFKTVKDCPSGTTCNTATGDCVSAAVDPNLCSDVLGDISALDLDECVDFKEADSCPLCTTQAAWDSHCGSGYNACRSGINYCYKPLSTKDGDDCTHGGVSGTCDQGICKSGSSNCGNDLRNSGEPCDGTDLSPYTSDCSGYPGYTGGTLACNADCSDFDTSDCTGGPLISDLEYCENQFSNNTVIGIDLECISYELASNPSVSDCYCSDCNTEAQWLAHCTSKDDSCNPGRSDDFANYSYNIPFTNACQHNGGAWCYVLTNYNSAGSCNTTEGVSGTCSNGKCVALPEVCPPLTTCCDSSGQYASAGTSCTTSAGKAGNCSGSSTNCTCIPTKTSCTSSDCGQVDNGCGIMLTCCCPDGSSCSDASTCCSPYCADTAFTGSKICKDCTSSDQWCDGKMAGCDQGTHYTDPDSNSYLCQSCDNSSPERYWFSDVSGCCGDDENDYFNDGANGGCWNKTREHNTDFVPGYKEVAVEEGVFHGCAIDHEWAITTNPEADLSRTNKKPYKSNDWIETLQDNIANSNLITDHTYCDNISSGINEKFCSYKEEWVNTGGKNRSHLSYINWSDQIDWQTTTIQEAECCEPTKCWNGSNCVNNQAATQDIYTYPGTNLRCIDGEWKESPLKSTWDNLGVGYCPTVEQCLVTPNGNYDNNNNPSMFNYNYLDNPTSSSSSNSPQCINDNQYIGDHYCEKGAWTTRTKFLALQLLSVTESSSDPNDYTLFCDDYANVLNYYSYTLSIGASTNYIYEYFIKQTNGCKIYPESAPVGVIVSCANKVCVLSYKKNDADSVVVGVSLNQPINSTKYSFLEALSKSKTYCSNAYYSDGKFHSCDGIGNIWYNSELQLVVYAKDGVILTDITFWNKFVSFLKNPFKSIFNTIINVIKPTYGTNIISYEFINKTKDFDRIYLNQKGESKSIKGITEKIGNEEFLSVTYTGIAADICESVDAYIANSPAIGDVISCNQTANMTYYVETRYESRLNSWYDLTSKLRVQ